METAMCRICLAKNVRMNWIVNTELQHVYETLTHHLLEAGARPLVACYICFAQLQHCYQLSVRCLKAEEILTKIINGDQDCYDENNLLNPGKLLSLTPITHVTSSDVFTSGRQSYNTQLKEEPVSEDDDNEEINPEEVEDEYKLRCKEETEPSPEPDLSESTTQVDEEHNQTPCRSFEDELPLATLSHIQKLDTNNKTGHVRKDKTAIQKRVPVSKMCRNTFSPRMAPDECSSIHCFQCDICQMSYNEKSYLISHIQTHVGEKYGISQNSYDWKNTLDKRTEIHNDQKPHKCDVFQKSFSQMSSLERHIRIHTGDNPYKCDICQKIFNLKSSLKRHNRIHTGDKPHKCDVCQKSFSQMSHLERHIRIHTGDKLYNCDVCKKSFRDRSNLVKHIKMHIGDKRYKCDVCQKSFSQLSNLERHVQIHTGDKPYNCDVCQKSFSQMGNLKCHIRIHTGDKPYKCDVCQKRFSLMGHLKCHIRIHTGDKPYKCDVCQKSFSHKSTLKCHKSIHTGDKPFKCDVCQKSFTEKSKLKYHIRIHTGVKS